MVAARILRDLRRRGKGEIVVLNDEAHHCYQDKPLERPDERRRDKEDEERNRDARVWFQGLQAIRTKVGIKAVYDLSATPVYLKGSGYNEGFIFPWVVSDFSLMDAIESGIVKVPRIPVDDDAAGDVSHLPAPLGPRRAAAARRSKHARSSSTTAEWMPPEELEGALQSLYRSYERRFEHWEAELAPLGEPPPVMIVVCPNTLVSKLVFDWIAGREVELDDGTTSLVAGELPLLSQRRRRRLDRRGRARSSSTPPSSSPARRWARDFKQAAAHEIEAFKDEYRRRNPGADVDKLTDEDLLREVMNTVGKKGKLGEHVRCVVSVVDAHRGLGRQHRHPHPRHPPLRQPAPVRAGRRPGAAPPLATPSNDEGRFEPEYAEVYGVPVRVHPRRPAGPEAAGPPPAVEVRALDERGELRDRASRSSTATASSCPTSSSSPTSTTTSPLHLDQSTVALWVENAGHRRRAPRRSTSTTSATRAPQRGRLRDRARRCVARRVLAAHDGVERPWLFPQLVDDRPRVARRRASPSTPDATIGMLLLDRGHAPRGREGVRRDRRASRTTGADVLLPILRRFDPEGSTDDVRFFTRKVVMDRRRRSRTSTTSCSTARGQHVGGERSRCCCERHDDVAAYVKNDHLGFTIPYVHEGRTHQYVPDFLVRLVTEPDDVERTLIVEVSGGRKSPGPTAGEGRHRPRPVVRRRQQPRRLRPLGLRRDRTTMAERPTLLDDAIENLYADDPITRPRAPERVGA